MVDPEDITYSQLELCTYRYLQQVAKSLSLPSNVKKVYLIEMIRAKKYSSPESLEAIIARIKQERLQSALLKKFKRKKKRVQGTEISSTNKSHSPPLTMTPKRSPNCVITYPPSTKYHKINLLRPTTNKKQIESDRVLRSFNTQMRPNYSILNVNSSVYGVIKAQNALQRSQEEKQYPMSVFQRHQVYVRNFPQKQKAIGFHDGGERQSYGEGERQSYGERERQLVPVVRNYNISQPRPAKRQRQISGIYPLKPSENYYRYTPCIDYRRSDGRITKINAVVQRPHEKLPEPPGILTQKLISLTKVIQKRIVPEHQRNLDIYGNSSTESANSYIERQIVEEDKGTRNFQTTSDNSTQTAFKSIKTKEMRNLQPVSGIGYTQNQNYESKSIGYTNNQNYEPEVLINYKEPLNNDPKTLHYENQKKETKEYGCDSENRNNVQKGFPYTDNQRLEQENLLRYTDSQNNKPKDFQYTENQNNQNVCYSENQYNGPKVRDTGSQSNPKDIHYTNSHNYPKVCYTDNKNYTIDPKDGYYIENQRNNPKDFQYTDNHNPKGRYNENRNNDPEDFRNTENEHNNPKTLFRHTNTVNNDPKTLKRHTNTVNNDPKALIRHTETENNDLKTFLGYTENEQSRHIENYENQYVPTIQGRNMDYPNMAALTDVYPNTHLTELSSNSQGKFSVYYHKKIRAEKVRNQRTSMQKDAMPVEERLPKITDVFSQFNDVQYKHLTQPLYVQVSQESERMPFTPPLNNNIVLEYLYSFKSPYLANQPVLQLSKNNTKCVYSTHTITTACTPLSMTTSFLTRMKLNRAISAYERPNPYNIETETMPRLYDYLKMAEQERQNIECDEVLNTTGSVGSNSSQDLEANVTIPDMVEDALELISQDGDYMERVGMDERMQCIICSWAGPKTILEYHIRKEHSSAITEVESEWSVTFPLVDIWSQAAHRLFRVQGDLYILTAACVGPHLYVALSTPLTVSEDLPQYYRLTIYKKATIEPLVWKGEISQLSDTTPYKTDNGFKLDITSLNLLPSGNFKLVNGELVTESNEVVGQQELSGILITLYVKVFD